ncbi:MAG TPA: hypothetical protein VFB34_13995 [Chloroflexota bacterium]|nr:hypothetical protein [Chloroflexota bacterium]
MISSGYEWGDVEHLTTAQGGPRESPWGKLLLLEGDQLLEAGYRLTLSSSVLNRLGPALLICSWFEPCLRVYPRSRWQAIMSSLCGMSDLRFEARLLLETVRKSAVELTLESTGEAVLPRDLRFRACIHRKVVVASGAGHVEIWNPDLWSERQSPYISDAERIIDAV